MVWIVNATYVKDYIIAVEFNDNKKGEVNFKDALNLPIFEPLNDFEIFKKFKLNGWTIEWENGADFSPEFIYDKLIPN